MLDMPRGIPHNWLIGGLKLNELAVFVAYTPHGISKIPKEKFNETRPIRHPDPSISDLFGC